MSAALLERAERIARLVTVRPAGRTAAGTPGQRVGAVRGHGLMFREHRQYEYADDMRRIDWNVTARHGRPFVKVFEEEQAGSAVIALDASASMIDWPSPSGIGELGREIAAVLALACARGDERVGMLAYTDRIEASVAPGRGLRHGRQIARAFAATQCAGRATDLNGLCDAAARLLPQRGMILVVSDYCDPSFEAGLAKLAGRHDVVAVVLSDTARPVWPARGLVRVCDVESGGTTWVDVSDRQTIDPARRTHVKRIERVCYKHGIGLIVVDVDRPYWPLLRRFWRARLTSRMR